MFDVEGRQTIGRTGVKRVDGERGALKFSEFGLAPQDTHKGAIDASNAKGGLKHFEVKYSETASVKGKKHIDMVHQQPLEVQKRMSGKIGLKKLKAPTHPEPQQRTKPSINSQTCEQRARDRLEKAIKAENPMSPVAKEALQTNTADAIIAAEKKVYRQIAIARAKEWQEQAGEKKVGNRAPPSSKSAMTTPFATSNASEAPAHHHHRRAVPAPERREPRHHGVAVSAARQRQEPIPFDTKFTCAEYPDPPRVGVAVSSAQKRGKQYAQPAVDRHDTDELANKRAEARRPNTSGGMPDFLYGNIPPPQAKRARVNPSNASGIPCGDPPIRNRAVDPQKYKPTSLW